MDSDKINQDEYIKRLEQWCLAAQEVIALGVDLMPIDYLREWVAVRGVQESCPVKIESKGLCDGELA